MLAMSLAVAGPVDLALYSVDGRLVKSLAHGAHDAGTHFVPWDGTNEGGRRVPAGVYHMGNQLLVRSCRL